MNIADKSPKELYDERVKRILDAAALLLAQACRGRESRGASRGLG